MASAFPSPGGFSGNHVSTALGGDTSNPSTPTWAGPARTRLPGLSRRGFILGGLSLAAVLAGCGSSADPEGSSGSAPTTDAAEPASKSITNKYGTYTIPTDPDRLVLMENRVELEIATALGLTPVAVGNFFTFVGGPVDWVAPWVPYKPSGAEQVFKSFEVDIEHVFSLMPDLIMSDTFWLDSDDPPARAFAALSNVAPVLPTGLGSTWRDDLHLVAGWMEREDRLASTLREFDDLRDGIKQRHQDALATAQVAMGTAEPPGLHLTTFNAGAPAPQALRELGGRLMPFSQPEAEDGGWYELSEEQINELDRADGALLWAPNSDARAALLASPLWPTIPAVQGGRVVVSEQNIGSGHLYTIMECMRLWDRVYESLG